MRQHCFRNHTNKSNQSLFLLIAGILVVSFWKLLGIILIIVGGANLLFGKRKKFNNQESLFNSIREDARSHGAEIPKDRDLWIMLRKLYRKYNSSVKNYPEVREEFDAIMDAVWQHISLTDDPLHWKVTIKEALEDWPVDSIKTSKQIKDALKKAKDAANTWKESQKEAWEGNY